MADRLPCIVPFCPRSRLAGDRAGYEWICGDHWRLTSRAWRKRFFLFRRRGRQDLADSMWARLKAQAIERGLGIAA